MLLLSYLDKIRLILTGEAGQALACLYTVDAESIDWSLYVDNFFPV